MSNAKSGSDKREANDERRARSRERQDGYSRDGRSGGSHNEKEEGQDSAAARKKAEDPYWYPGKGKFSHPTKMPSQNPFDPKPRNPKRTQSCRTESPGHRHECIERKHDRREQELEALANGTLRTPPGAGPNWANNREATLAKYAKATNRRHKKHEKNMRKLAEQAAGQAAEP
ncbi:hypothetical protein PtrSN002B_006556 [Pyrenophora tritici-repentis]|nr:hypothetical protein PtrSN002B_006556 [Pyrenophora tritici-repentis]